MKVLNRIFFVPGFCFLTLLGSVTIAIAQKTSLPAIAGPKGIWVICGDQLPKDFTYSISRQKNGGDWVKVADVAMPPLKDQIQASVLNIQRLANLEVEPLSAERLQGVWDRISNNIIKDSPAEIKEDLVLRAATGTAWYDAEADSATAYRYKVEVTGKAETYTNIIQYPVKKFVTDIIPSVLKPGKEGIYAEFEVIDKGQMTRCKILRSYYLRTGFEAINATPLFIKRGGKLIINFIDNTAVAKVPYTYVVQPFDAAGNKGFASPELKAFNVPDKSIAPSVNQFRAHSVEAKKAIRLGWKLADTRGIITIDIYKSDSYDGKYFKIASVAPTDTTYMDFLVKPITGYFYTIKLNGYYETSPLSPRIPGILKASSSNLYPPDNLQIQQDGNKVILTWSKNEDDTRAYFVYRANGKTGEMKQLGPPIITTNADITYVDTLPVSAKPRLFAYTVADENTSYAISPKTAPVYAGNNGLGTLPIPYKVTVRKTDNNKLQVIWPNMLTESQTFLGYAVFRSITNAVGETSAPQQITKRLIPITVDTFIDTAVSDAGVYHYTVCTVGFDGKKLSSPSPEGGYTIYEEIPGMVSNIKLIPSKNSVELNWNNPIGEDIQNIQISRAVEGKDPELVATLTADKQTYTDKDIAVGNTYYYTFTTKNKKGKGSTATDLVGIRIK